MRQHPPATVAIATATATRTVREAIAADPGRAVLVRSPRGGGARLVVEALDRRTIVPRGARVAPPAHLDLLDPATLLSLRPVAREATLLLSTEANPPSPSVRALLDYLRPVVLDVAPLTDDEVAAVLEHLLGRSVDDLDAARVRRWTAGWIDDTIAVAAHLTAPLDGPDTTTAGRAALPDRLRGFEPKRARRFRATGDGAAGAAWAMVTAAGAAAVPVDQPWPSTRWNPVDAAAWVGDLTDEERRAALDVVLERAAEIPAASLDADSLVALGPWWCEADRTALDATELGHLIAALQLAFERNRLRAALPIAARLWQRSRVPLAGVALASVLGRAPSDGANRDLLDELARNGSAAVVDAVAATEATWRFHHEGRADEAVALLRDRLQDEAGPTDPAERHDEAARSTLATLELHRGRPDAAEALLELAPGGAGGPTGDDTGQGPTPFGLNTLVLADLARGRHRRAIDRLDAELSQRLDPGPNLSVDRDRFFRNLVAAEAGWADANVAADLARSYGLALDGGDDWSIGWMGWGTGLHAARTGRFLVARRRLRATVAAFERAGRPGFAMWPASALVELEALVELDPAPAPTTIPFDHPVLAGRARAELAIAIEARAEGAPTAAVAASLDRAMATARATGEVTAARLVAIEQVLAGLPTAVAVDDLADGVVGDAWAGLEGARLEGAGVARDSMDDAGRALIEGCWTVLGVRLRAAAAAGAARTDPRAAGRILQEVRTTTATFDAALRPWALADQLPDLPTLSARELEVAEAVAGDATRDEVAAALIVSRRTVDSHLQRAYAKLGVTSRAELRTWLDRSGG